MITSTINVIYAVLPIIVTPPMFLNTISRLFDGKFVGINKTWVSYDEISPNFFKACLASEDSRFLTHNGIDWIAVENAIKYNQIHKDHKKRGASTISMQTAKNTYLYHNRTYLRKGLELYFTSLIESFWGKKRILEVYANIVEFGEGIYGVEAASRKFFNKSSKNLTRTQAALLVAVLPNPHRWSPTRPTNYIFKRVATIKSRMRSIELPKEYYSFF